MNYQELFKFFGKQYKRVYLEDGWAIYPSFACSLPAPDWFTSAPVEEEYKKVSLRQLVDVRFENGKISEMAKKLVTTARGTMRVVDRKGNIAELRHLGENVFIREDYYQLVISIGKGLVETIYHSDLEGVGMVIVVGVQREPLFLIGQVVGDFKKMDVYIKKKEGNYESIRGKNRRSSLPRAGHKGKPSSS